MGPFIQKTNNMEKEFIEYSEALALKELGFDEPCVAFYEQSKRLSIGFNWLNEGGKNSNLQECTAPLYQQAFRWFRENHFIYPSIIQLRGWVNSYKIIKWDSSCDATTVYDSNNYGTYEEAELECLKKLIEIVKIK
jgi:hypothetical protein